MADIFDRDGDIPAWEPQPGDHDIVGAAGVILLEDLDDAPLIRAVVMGGQGRTGEDMTFSGAVVFYAVLVFMGVLIGLLF